ncbi:Hypothetical protein GL50581_2039 [Giardia duodenalis ATCC 50581]|uniref:RING-type domain-containing protein n=1 Tax=Giardia intestinalis (strain ATCC 50581 / GS clone H7) TaxID=598745 RepID=C6LTE2_GIAIB|nr:Hypothetical protein GL50581_2039 [Giardia intestinalis ATCC 50581]
MFRGFSFEFTTGPNERNPRGNAEDFVNELIGDSALQIKILNNQIHALNRTIASLFDEKSKLLEEFNEQQFRLNFMERRYETFKKVIKALDVKPSNDNTDDICPICMDALGEKKVRGIGCPPHHSICPSCFGALCASSDELSCPLCRGSLDDEDLVIE